MQSTMESGYTEALLDLTSKKEVLVSRMHDRVMDFVEVRAEPRSLQTALLSSQDLIRQVCSIRLYSCSIYPPLPPPFWLVCGVKKVRVWSCPSPPLHLFNPLTGLPTPSMITISLTGRHER